MGDGMEQDCHAHFSGPADPERVALVSIAISLKRIADALRFEERGKNFYDLVSDIRYNTRGAP